MGVCSEFHCIDAGRIGIPLWWITATQSERRQEAGQEVVVVLHLLSDTDRLSCSTLSEYNSTL